MPGIESLKSTAVSPSQVGGSQAPSLAKATALIRLSRPRYLALTIPPFVVAVLNGYWPDSRYLLIGLVAILLLRVISSVGNCLSDRVEDTVDHPNRGPLCEMVGYGELRRIVDFSVVAFLLLVAGPMAIGMGVYWLAIVCWLGTLLLKWSYSFGPRLKPRRWSATALLGGLSGGMFAVGWFAAGAYFDSVALIACGVLWAMGSTLSGSKDVPNVSGDEQIGYESPYVRLTKSRGPFLRAMLKVSFPYAIVVASVVAGYDTSALWCLVGLPLATCFVTILLRAQSDLEREVAREAGYLYWLSFQAILLISLFPTVQTFAVTLGGVLWYVVASRIAHPDVVPVDTSGAVSAWRMLTVPGERP